MLQSSDQFTFFDFKNPILITNEFFINKYPHNSLHNDIVNQDPNFN